MTPNRSTDLKPGDVLDGITLIERRPGASMAALWNARSAQHDFPLIVKVPFFEPGQDVSMLVSFEVEELIARRLSGPHMPRFVGSGDIAKLPYLAMEFVPGRSLAEVAERAPLPPEEVARIGAAVATALVSLHGQKVAHLDLKPENVIMAARGAVLIDFGLSRHADLPDLLGEESSLPIGTAAYISPEQVLGERTDTASDIYALGCILYQLATGIEPFGRPQTFAGMKRRLYHEPRRLHEVDASVPRWLDAVVHRCMEVDRGRRYADAAHVLSDLRNPDQVPLAERQAAPRGMFAGLHDMFRRKDDRALVGRPAARGQGVATILAAVDLSSEADALAGEVLAETARLIAARGDSRLACVTVLKTEIIGNTPDGDENGVSTYLKRLVALKDWARPLHLPETRISYHVLEAVGPADAILNYARHNDVGHIVVGARASSALRRHLGSVSSKIVAEALCSVSVMRARAAPETDAA
jgi:nucleotide-binding universal stress UspA family protein